MKIDFDNLKGQIRSTDASIRNKAIKEIARFGDAKNLRDLFQFLIKNRISNGISLTVKAIGISKNTHAIEPLIDVFETANHPIREMIIASLLKLGAFDKFFGGNRFPINIQERLFALLFASSSSRLRSYLALEPEEFHKKLDFAWSITKHWRNKR